MLLGLLTCLIFSVYGGIVGVLVDGEVISYTGDTYLLGNMLVLAGHEGCLVVERNCFHRSEWSLSTLLPGFPKIASVLTPVICTVGGRSLV